VFFTCRFWFSPSPYRAAGVASDWPGADAGHGGHMLLIMVGFVIITASLDVRFTPKATEFVRDGKMSRRATRRRCDVD
jgi:hypothetical protein